MLWRRLESPGHDACHVDARATGWELHGGAAFRHNGTAAWLAYRVSCDQAWRTLRGEVQGWLGERAVECTIIRAANGAWTFNGALVPGLDSLVDLDLSFTPATNFLQLRRIALAVGHAADVPVAWLEVSKGSLEFLPQRYERRTETTYWYEAPTVGYAGLLEINSTGFVSVYPGLWEEERSAHPGPSG
jgi:hypothetical protein